MGCGVAVAVPFAKIAAGGGGLAGRAVPEFAVLGPAGAVGTVEVRAVVETVGNGEVGTLSEEERTQINEFFRKFSSLNETLKI